MYKQKAPKMTVCHRLDISLNSQVSKKVFVFVKLIYISAFEIGYFLSTDMFERVDWVVYQ